eukprot:scaffold20658_cov101-Isochrysis_galbana.AAC.4
MGPRRRRSVPEPARGRRGGARGSEYEARGSGCGAAVDSGRKHDSRGWWGSGAGPAAPPPSGTLPRGCLVSMPTSSE